VFANYVIAVRHSLRPWLAVLALMTFLPLTFMAVSSAEAASTHSSCHAPRLIGLTVSAARNRAKTSHCELRLKGASVRMAKIQTIHAQSARPGSIRKLLSVTVNPLCPGSSEIGPPRGEPLLTPGPTVLNTGLFIEGGAFIYRSAPVCKNLVGTSSAGTITVTSAGGTVIANKMTVNAGQELEIALNAGQYTVTGVFAGGNNVGPVTVTVLAGDTVRQDLVLPVP